MFSCIRINIDLTHMYQDGKKSAIEELQGSNYNWAELPGGQIVWQKTKEFDGAQSLCSKLHESR